MGTASKKAETREALPGLLLIDDDALIGESLGFVLRDDFDVTVVAGRPEAKKALRGMTAMPPLAVVDLGLPPDPHDPSEGFALIGELLVINPAIKILVLSGQNERANIKRALTLGAADFIPKPCDPALLKARLNHHLMMLEAEREDDAVHDAGEGHLLGRSPVMDALRSRIEQFAQTPFPLLIEGESGTGKELIAELLHERSEGRDAPFLTLNCAAFTPELLEAQLFGHAQGAFTGARGAKAGFFEDAGDGILFLDEVGEFPVPLQPKLLRVLENGEYYRIGETRPRVSKARIIAATNRNLQEDVRSGRFRQDLYHRLSVLTVTAPPLRERGRDSVLLLDHFRQLYATKVSPFELDEEAQHRWLSYTFPGNVRELRNIVIRLGAKYPGRTVSLTELEAELDSRSEVDEASIDALRAGDFKLDATLNAWEQRYITAAMQLSNGNLSEAARMLGVNRTTLYSRVQRLKEATEEHPKPE